MSKKNVTVLVVDDETDFLEIYSHVVSRMGYTPLLASSSAEALHLAERRHTRGAQPPIDVAIIDYQLPQMNGQQLLAALKKIDRHIQALFITGYENIPGSGEAAALGVYDCITKPLNLPQLERVLARLAATRRMALENLRLHNRLRQLDDHRNIIGQTPQMQALFDDMGRLANSERSLIIRGEVGTGKRLFAKAIHKCGHAGKNPFLTFDCLMYREDQFEKKIFGEHGANGRAASPQAAWRHANNGTLFIRAANLLHETLVNRLRDEVKAGKSHQSASQAPRLIFSITEKFAAEATQRSILWANESFTHVHIPPLRERRDDIPLLAQHFLKKMNTDKRHIDRTTPQAMQIMQQYSWPGNVRELRNTIKRALEVGHTNRLSVSDLPMYIIEATEQAINRSESLRSLHLIEKKAILETLRLVQGDKARAAEVLRIDRSTLYRKLKHYGLH